MALEDIWNLPPIEGNETVDTPEEDQTGPAYTTTRHFWEAEFLANKHHDCSWCRKEICPSEYYHRIAIPMHTYVVVQISCMECYRP
jgi:hypothetical protein